jgi:hypothetical protein
MSAPADGPGISVANHPRTRYAVRRAKASGGLLGVALCGLLGLRAGVPTLEVMLRALVAGVTGYVVLWAVAVAVARQLVIAEVRARYAEVRRAAEARHAAAAAAGAPEGR